MLTPFKIYLIMQADMFGNILTGISMLLIILALTVFATSYDINEKEEGTKIIKISITSGIFAFIFFISGALIPSTKTAVAMYLLPEIANSQVMHNLPDNLNKLVDNLVKKTES